MYHTTLIKQPKEYYVWFDSLTARIAKGSTIKVNSSNGLSDSYTFTRSESISASSSSGCVGIEIESIYCNYYLSIYNHTFEFNFDFYEKDLGKLIDSICSKPYMELHTVNSNYKYLSDSLINRFTIHNRNTGLSYERNGWNYIGKFTLNGMTYDEVYNLTNLLGGDYKNIVFDKHFGLLQFTEANNTVWSIKIE